MKILVILLSFYTLMVAYSWELQKEADGIKVFTKSMEDSDYLAYRGVTIVDGSVSALVAILYDTERAPEWLHDCSFGVTLEEVTFENNYVFETYSLPFPFTDRQLIIHSQLTYDGKNARLESVEANTFCLNREDTRCREVKEMNLVVVSRSRGHYELTYLAPYKTRVIWEQHIESGGSLPTWLVNASVVDIPFNSLKRLQILVKDPRYKNQTMNSIRSAWQVSYDRHH